MYKARHKPTGATVAVKIIPNGPGQGASEDKAIKDEIGYDEIITDTEVVKVSAVGVGMRSHACIASTMFQTLAQEGINILMISTSTIRVSVILPAADMERAARSLLEAS